MRIPKDLDSELFHSVFTFEYSRFTMKEREPLYKYKGVCYYV